MDNNAAHITPIQIRFNDIDGLGHVNNSVFACYFDLGRTRYLEAISGEKVDWGNPGLIIKRTETVFESPVFINDIIEVETRITRLGNKSFDMTQDIVDVESRQIKATCHAVMVGFDKNSGSSIPIPEHLIQAILVSDPNLRR